MLQDFLASGPLTIVYLAVLLLSAVFGLLSLFGGTSTEFDMNVDVDEIDFLNISPFGLAMAGVVFGVVGLVTQVGFEMAAWPSLLWALTLAVLVGASIQALFLFVISPRRKATAMPMIEAGLSAVSLTPLTNTSIGQIEFGPHNKRTTIPARASSAETIVAGEMVIVEEYSNGVATVVLDEDPHH